MKYSVLLPTRNRLEYLHYAVETVRRQQYADWEIIVSDNFSTDDIAGYIRSLDDARIRYFRTADFVPVTENWNNALTQSAGDYVIMLGDDDGLLPGYFQRLDELLKSFPDPDFIYSGAYFFAYPGVLPDKPDGFLTADHNSKLHRPTPYWLDPDSARQIAAGYCDFRMPVASNMQFSVISRHKIAELSASGPFFRSPYPDFFATPALFLKSSRILIVPTPMVIIGITPKSYGFYHFNNRAPDGVQLLNNSQALGGDPRNPALMLPGTSYYDSWLLASEALCREYGQSSGLQPNYQRYRFLQTVHVYKRHLLDGTLPRSDFIKLRQRLRLGERLTFALALSAAFRVMALVPDRLLGRVIAVARSMIGQHAIRNETGSAPRFGNLLEVFEARASSR